MKAGFAETDITPRVGVQLFGFGPYINRISTGIRDPLGARAAVLEDNSGKRCVVIGCDLGCLPAEYVSLIRQEICRHIPGVAADDIMVCCSHTHSGPAVGNSDSGWGAPDLPYVEILPYKIASSAIDAWKNLEEVHLSAARVPCRHIGINREYDIGNSSPLEEVLKEDWEPAHPELTDTEVLVIRCDGADGQLKGFFASFSCHPVVCCKETHLIHGDYPGVALHQLMRQYPGSVGIFLQGALGDVNTGCVHQAEQPSMLALDIFASRFANAVRNGLEKARNNPVPEKISSYSKRIECSVREAWDLEFLLEKEREFSAVLHRAEASDAGYDERIAAVKLPGVRKMISDLKNGKKPVIPAEIHALRIGSVELLGAPFEIMQAIKNEVIEKVNAPIPAVVGLANGYNSYAPDRALLAKTSGYAATTAPFIVGQWPLEKIHDELVEAFIEADRKLFPELNSMKEKKQ
ncbi:MAG: neutral/alkaline non-lysosomal ceramidase N-terminal domain-containing protein [Lentisphaeria bacterium]|nr:neutral/alkaline non-lysosomal ceramidase N-terminal domain-containing protein [Lentisphaeria bacterium]